MEPISNVDRLVVLLRQRLQARDRTRSSGATGERKVSPKTGGVAAAQALAAIEEVDERHLRRALIQGLLSERFGEGMLNEPRFQQVVDQVLSAIESDEAGRALLERISREMRAAAR